MNTLFALAVWAVSSMQDPLTPEAIEGATDFEITLWSHSGDKSTGETTRIKSDGTVVRISSNPYAIVAAEQTATIALRLPLSKPEVAALAKGFAKGDVLKLPAQNPRLIEPKEAWPKTMRYTLGLSIPGKGVFEGEHPDIQWSKLEQTPAARELIASIRTAVKKQEAKIEALDQEYLSGSRLKLLLTKPEAALNLELHDLHGLWGGRSLRLDKEGKVSLLVLRRPAANESGMQVERREGRIDPAAAVAIFKTCTDNGTFDLHRKRDVGIPDEAAPGFRLQAVVDGATYTRTIWMFDGEARQTPAFESVRRALADLEKQLPK